eukprot:1194257-Prorocentrum_minimum.AAC.3
MKNPSCCCGFAVGVRGAATSFIVYVPSFVSSFETLVIETLIRRGRRRRSRGAGARGQRAERAGDVRGRPRGERGALPARAQADGGVLAPPGGQRHPAQGGGGGGEAPPGRRRPRGGAPLTESQKRSLLRVRSAPY